MIFIFCLLATAARADQAIGRGQATLDMIWTHLTGRFPKLLSLDMKTCADESCVWINDARLPLRKPGPAFDRLPGARLVGSYGDPQRPWMLFRTPDPNALLIWAYYDRPIRRLKFAGCDQPACDAKALMITRAYLNGSLADVPDAEFISN